MSHELRTPLNAIVGFGQLLAMNKGSLSLEDKECVDQIQIASKILLEHVNDILDLASIESGKLNLDIVPISIDQELRECVNLMKVLSNEHDVKLIYSGNTDDKLHLYADRRRFKQIIINLISNAIKYNKPDGKVTIYYSAINDKFVRISVEDTGQGIDAKIDQHIFKPFERIAHNRSYVDGTGVGLSIAKLLVESMNGLINFESTPGEGSRFWVDMQIAIT